ncbi:MAG: lysophospholipid acyltransferase family protein [Anaerolineaceae bacterium]|nr:lysophospholipid acyltransferase family protein [Anaerolineaceae bacterium]
MSLVSFVVNNTLKALTRILCRIDDTQLVSVPPSGPLILVANHINFLEIPVIITHLQPRQVTGLIKKESFDNPFFNMLFNMWGGISIRRGEADLEAFRRALIALAKGQILAIAPEGTRSGTGKLNKGNPGVVLLALRSRAPILPMGYYGSEQFWTKIRAFKRTDFKIVVGSPFTIRDPGTQLSRPVRHQITDEIMYQLAALLPPRYRGHYADLSQATETYLVFPPGSSSNLARAAT